MECIGDKCNFTLLCMIKSFKNKHLKLLWQEGVGAKLPSDQIARIKEILDVIDSAEKAPHDFLMFKNWKIHPLKGNRKGIWSLTVKDNWRIVFRFENQNAHELDYLDYH